MKNIYILPTPKPSRLHEFGGIWFSHKEPAECFRNHNLFITSDEKIKDGDWHLKLPNKTIGNYPLNSINPNKGRYKKIILTTDQDLIKDGVQSVSDEFLEWLVNNPSCESVEVKFETLWLNKRFGGTWQPFPDEQATESKKDYKIIIPKEEIKN